MPAVGFDARMFVATAPLVDSGKKLAAVPARELKSMAVLAEERGLRQLTDFKRVDPHRLDDVLERRRAEIADLQIEPRLDLANGWQGLRRRSAEPQLADDGDDAGRAVLPAPLRFPARRISLTERGRGAQ